MTTAEIIAGAWRCAQEKQRNIKRACAKTDGRIECRVEVWEDLLWYAYQPDTGVHATAMTRDAALRQVAELFSIQIEQPRSMIDIVVLGELR